MGLVASVALTEFSLGALEVVVGALPLRPLALAARRGPKCVAVVGDGVVEAVGLDARCGLLPGASSARRLRESAQRFREVWGWPFEGDA